MYKLKTHTKHGIQPFALFLICQPFYLTNDKLIMYIRIIILFFASLVGAIKTPGHGRNVSKKRLLNIQNTVADSKKKNGVTYINNRGVA